MIIIFVVKELHKRVRIVVLTFIDNWRNSIG